jgi:hypothetical protein
MRCQHLLPCQPDKAEAYGYDARAIVDHRSIVRPGEQSCPLCEQEKPNSNKERANDPKGDLHDSQSADLSPYNATRPWASSRLPPGGGKRPQHGGDQNSAIVRQ